MQHLFYDTCSLLSCDKHIFSSEDKIYISNISFRELENIKTDTRKDPDIKYRARKLINFLIENENLYTTVNYQNNWDILIEKNHILSDNNDSRIILCAKLLNKDVTFVTSDSCCYKIAQAMGLKTSFNFQKEEIYKGYAAVHCKNNTELAILYNQIYDTKDNLFNLNINQYLVITDTDNNCIDLYKYTKEGLRKVPPFIQLETKMFGKVKPKDKFQLAALDSFENNQITVLRGPAGSGKSFLAIAYLLKLLERGKIDKIIIFCNTVATAGSARLGYYPGSKDEKLMDAQMGNFLGSKLGDKGEVWDLINRGSIVLLPLSDIRGFDTTGMNAGIYMTEAQNTDIDLMKLALQRIGEDSIAIIEGDDKTQVDLNAYSNENNGLKRLSEVFRGEEIYGEIYLENVYRSHIAKIAEKM